MSLQPFVTATAVADPLIRGAEDPTHAERRVTAQVSAHVVFGVLNEIEIEHVALSPVRAETFVGQVTWLPPALARDDDKVPQYLRHRAPHRLLNAYVAGRAAQLLEAFGWPGATFALGYAAPETECILALAELISPHDPWPVIRHHIADVSFVIQNEIVAQSIRLVAGHLNVQRRLTGNDATNLVTSALASSKLRSAR